MTVEARDPSGPLAVQVRHFGDVVAELHVAAGQRDIDLGTLPPGGYGIEASGPSGVIARTAVEVSGSAASTMRYGFVTDYHPGRDLTGVADTIRRLHLTDIQFYDWAYRHADLLGGGDTYTDALKQPISLATVRELIDAAHTAGARALGYAAVYGVGNDEWPAWAHDALLDADGKPYGLADFLSLVDPAAADWLAHFTADLAASTRRLGFDGYHLDQYGYPKTAARTDGRCVRVEDSFATLIESARAALPDARLVFNNVNDFPTWRTATCPQDAVYIEVWAPHTDLAALVRVVTRARATAPGKPVIVAAYQHVYDTADILEADLATRYTMATLYSHGASHLLCGEADRILVDPYYVRNHVVEPSTHDMLTRWYDFLVEHGELLGGTDVTGAYVDSYNDDLTVAGAPASVDPEPGSLWQRATAGPAGSLVLHLINLVDQAHTDWDRARTPNSTMVTPSLRIRRTGSGLPRVRYADPDGQARLVDLPVSAESPTHATVTMPAQNVWALLLIDPA